MIRRLVILSFLLAPAPVLAQSQSPVTIIKSGDPAKRWDILVLGDGYTQAEMARFAADAQSTMDRLFGGEPLQTYRGFFNVQRLDVPSAESGASHPERNPPVKRNTAFDASYNCSGIERLICVNIGKVQQAIANIPPAQRDVVLVLVNDAEYGGSGGFPVVASLDASVVELVLHETGHSFGDLADEYDSPGLPCDTSKEPSEPNVTKQADRTAVKWKLWIDSSTQVPTTTTTLSVPGIYQGARYCTAGLYRPTYDSKMRTLGRAFDQINTEQLIRRYYSLVAPYDSVTPEPGRITPGAAPVNFSVVLPAVTPNSIVVHWRLDGNEVGSGLSYKLDPATLPPGMHTVTATVADETSRVRSDPDGRLAEVLTWQLSASPPQVNQGGTVNGASFASGLAVAAGSIASVFGSNLGTGVLAARQLPLSAGLGNVSVLVNGIAAPLFFVSPKQINFQVPWELIGQTQASIVVEADGQTSPSQTFQLASWSPGIFTADSSGRGQGIVQMAGTVVLAAPEGSVPGLAARPIRRGEYLTLYCTGLGDVTNRPASGAAPGSALSEARLTPTLALNGVAALVTFAGLVPGFVGLYQVNALVPDNAPTGAAVQLLLTSGQAISNAVTIAIQ